MYVKTLMHENYSYLKGFINCIEFGLILLASGILRILLMCFDDTSIEFPVFVANSFLIFVILCVILLI